METIKIGLAYYIFINILLSITLLWQYVVPSMNVLSQHLVIASSIYFVLSLPEFIKRKSSILVVLYAVVILLSMQISGKFTSMIARWLIPLVILLTSTPRDYKYYKPLFYVCVTFFIANVSLALYERITHTHLISVSYENEILQNQLEYGYGTRQIANFRSLSLVGHPLSNAVIMSYMSFMLFFSFKERTKRFLIILLGFISLFCFNARGAILISGLLLIPTFWEQIRKDYKYRVFTIIFVSFLVMFFIGNFDIIGGRLVTDGVDDASTMERILTFKEFLSLSTSELLYGKHEVIHGENGYLMDIMEYGIFVGSAKILIELYFAFFALPKSLSLKIRFIIFFSLIAVGSTNNILYFPSAFPFYIMCVNFIVFNKTNKTNEIIVRFSGLLSNKGGRCVKILS